MNSVFDFLHTNDSIFSPRFTFQHNLKGGRCKFGFLGQSSAAGHKFTMAGYARSGRLIAVIGDQVCKMPLLKLSLFH